MFDRSKQCNLQHKMMIRLSNFLYVLNLRQGTILIAVHQIALSSFLLIILLVGISHAGEMLSMLHNDMEDDAERHGFYEVYGDQMTFHEGEVISTNNQKRFAKAQHLASVTVMFLYTSTILTSIYLVCCISLLYGAVKYRREYVVPWLLAAGVALVLLGVAVVVGDGYPCVVNFFGGHSLYHLSCALFILTFLYAICVVASFGLETGAGRCAREADGGGGRARAGAGVGAGDERGERLLLLDHAAHSSLLSSAQLSKLNNGTRTQFV